MKKLFTLYLIWVIILLINSNLFAQYSNSAFNSSPFFYVQPLNSLNLYNENSLGITPNISNNFNIYPNPNNGKFCINLKEPKSKIEVEINNIWGQKIYESSTLLPLPTNEIDLSLQPKGVYFVKIKDGEKIQTEKIMVQ
jgi:hypothetical protein